MSSVLYDVPGPRAIARNRVLGLVTVVVVAAVVGWLVWRLIATGQFTASKWEAFSYTAVWVQVAEATGRTLAAFALAAVGALILGFVLAVGRLSDHAVIRVPVAVVTEFLRAVPVLVMMFLLYYGLPSVGIRMDNYWVVVISLVAYNGSVLAEVIRAGVLAVPRGQSEAAYAIGLTKSGVMSLVLLPQAVRSMMPVILSQLVVTLKDTALGFIITYEELLFFARFIGSRAPLDSPIIPATIVVAVIYISLCLILSGIAKYVETRMARSPRTVGMVDPTTTAADAGATTLTEVIAQQREDAAPGPGGRPAR